MGLGFILDGSGGKYCQYRHLQVIIISAKTCTHQHSCCYHHSSHVSMTSAAQKPAKKEGARGFGLTLRDLSR